METAGVRVMAHEKYRLAHRLGSGGMADVFRAEITGAEGFSRPVAIKRLHAGVSADPDFCAMFVREARLLAALQHPNIVSVLDFEWDAERRLFLVMELVDGINLAQLVGRGQLPVPVAAYVVAEVLRGLGHAHGRGILHRDVTPHNVLLAWSGEVKLSDFGLAQVSASSRVSDRGSIRGKVPYLSPEQLQGLTIDGRSDLFSVGVMSYQLLTGCYPFFGRGDHPTMAESIARMLTAVVVPPRELRPEIPLELSDLVMRLLARDREQRYADTEQVLAALPAVIDGRKAVAALLAELFPGIAAGEAEPGAGAAEPGAGAAEPGAGAAGEAEPGEAEPGAGAVTPHAPRPAAERDTSSMPTPPERPRAKPSAKPSVEPSTKPSGQGELEPVAARPPRRRHLALLLILLIPLFGVPAMWWLGIAGEGSVGESTAGRAAGHAVADTRPHEAEAAGAAVGALLAEAGADADTDVASARPAEITEIDAAAQRVPVPTGLGTASVDGEVVAPAARDTRTRRVTVRLSTTPSTTEPRTGPQTGSATGSTTEPGAGPVSSLDTSDSPASSADAYLDTSAVPEPGNPRGAPTSAPPGRRYERGWTERGPQQTITGEVPIRRRERR